MKIMFALAVITALVIVWVMFIRPWLRKQEWAAGFFAWIEPVELALWKKSETILFARFKMVIGLLLTMLTSAGAIDITPLMPFVPDAWEPAVRILWGMLPLSITLVGWIDEQLRKDTTKPLEIVALTEKEKEKPAVAEALEVAEIAKVEAVAAVENSKIQEAA